MFKHWKQKHEFRVFKDIVTKLFKVVISLDDNIVTLLKEEAFGYANIIKLEKQCEDLIALCCVYRQNQFLHLSQTGNLNKQLRYLGEFVNDMDNLGRDIDRMAHNIKTSNLKEVLEDNVMDLDEEDLVELRKQLMSLTLQLNDTIFQMRQRLQSMRSVLCTIRYIVLLDYSKIVLHVDIIRMHNRDEKHAREFIVSALKTDDVREYYHHKEEDKHE